ncbi:SPOSA6832_03951, partial [Sporobolomyces salmonicolor]
TAAAAHAEQIVHACRSNALPSPVSLPSAKGDFALPRLPSLIPPSDLPPALTALEALETTLKQSSSSSEIELSSAKAVLAYGKYAVGEMEEALRILDTVDKECPKGDGWEGYDLSLRVLASAVEGARSPSQGLASFAAEQLSRRDQAQAAYQRAARVYDEALDLLARSGGTKDDLQLHRVGETALYRLCLISRTTSPPSTSHSHHYHYLRQSSAFYATASPAVRSLAYPPSHPLTIHRSFRQLQIQTTNFQHFGLNNKAEEALLQRTTALPKAGEVNVSYLRFLDEVAEGWKASGAGRDGAKEVVESQRLLRHLIRALAACDRHDEAAKSLRLYVELWDKSRETDAGQVAREMKLLRRKADREGKTASGEWVKVEAASGGDVEKAIVASRSALSLEGDLDADHEQERMNHDIDSEVQFVQTVAFGVRLLCKYLDEPKEALKLAQRMRAIFEEKGDEALVGSKVEEARIERSLGIALGALAAKDAHPETRPSQHADALAHLETAASLDPSSSHTLYHLAYQLFELRQTSRALDVAKQAVTLNKQSKEAWHLLGLLVSAQKDMIGALEVLETALDGSDDDEDDEQSAPPSNGDVLARPNGERRMAVTTSLEEKWDYPTDETERLAAEVQLRLTKNAVIEYLEGPAAALADQQEVLAFFSAAYAQIAESTSALLSFLRLSTAHRLPISTAPTTSVSPPIANGLDEDSGVRKRRTSILGRRRSLRAPSTRNSTASTLQFSATQSPASTLRAPSLPPPPGLAPSNLSLAESAARSRPSVETNRRATKLLVDIWLTSAASFRRAGKLDEAQGAVFEAEQLDAEDPDVWSQASLFSLLRRSGPLLTHPLRCSQLAQLHIARGETARARVVLQKAFSFDVDHLPSLILFSRLYLTPPSPSPPSPSPVDSTQSSSPADPSSWVHRQLPFAESLLDTLTKRRGWDSPEAWFELSRCYKHTERREKEKECLVWALQLEETRSVRSLGRALPRVL